MSHVTVHGGAGRCEPEPHEHTARYVARAIARAFEDQCRHAYEAARHIHLRRGDAESARMHDETLRAWEEARRMVLAHEMEE